MLQNKNKFCKKLFLRTEIWQQSCWFLALLPVGSCCRSLLGLDDLELRTGSSGPQDCRAVATSSIGQCRLISYADFRYYKFLMLYTMQTLAVLELAVSVLCAIFCLATVS